MAIKGEPIYLDNAGKAMTGVPAGRVFKAPWRSAGNALQQGIYERLIAGGINVWDGNNAKPEYPFVVIGEDLSSGVMTKQTIGYDHNVTLNLWNDEAGSFELKSYNSRIIDLLINDRNWVQLPDDYLIIYKRLDHYRAIPSDNGATNIARSMLYLDFRTIDEITCF